jgi:hypothetical protein
MLLSSATGPQSMVDLLSGHKRSVEGEDEGTVTLRRQEESGGLSDALPAPSSADEAAALIRKAMTRHMIITRLCPVAFNRPHQALCSLRVEGTGGWLLDSEPFTRWTTAPGSILWGTGAGEYLPTSPTELACGWKFVAKANHSKQPDVARQSYGKLRYSGLAESRTNSVPAQL